MVVKKKDKEQTEFEKRNTAIFIFVLVALVPLLLSFFLGWSMGNVEERNTDKLLVVLDSIRDDNAEMQKNIAILNNVFSKTDTLQAAFNEDMIKLRSDLLKIPDGDPDIDILIGTWKRQMTKKIGAFNDHLSDINLETEKIYNPVLAAVNAKRESWLENFTDIKKDELSAIAGRKMKTSNAKTKDELLEDIDALNDEVDDLNLQILLLNQSKGNVESQMGAVSSEKSNYKDDLEELQEKVSTAKEKVNEKVEEIRGILPDFGKNRLINTNREKERIQALKDDLEAKLRIVELSMLGLQ